MRNGLANHGEAVIVVGGMLGPGDGQVKCFASLMTGAGDLYAQVLVAQGLNIAGGIHDVVYVATGHDMLYAFDADSGQQYWSTSLGTPVPESVEGVHDIPNEVGVVGTPVIDDSANTLYLALRLNLPYSYLWGLLSPIIFRFSRHFPVEFRSLRVRNALLHIAAILS